MIRNERQYRITKAQAEKFERAVAEMESAAPAPDIHPVFQKAQMDAMKGQAQDLRRQLAEYDGLRSGALSAVEIESLEDLPVVLIKARIASGMTQEELATRLGIKPQQIQRYEATNHSAANLRRIIEISDALGLRVPQVLEISPGAGKTKI